MRGKGEGSIAQDKRTGLWVGRLELPAVNGERRRIVKRSKDKAVIVKWLSEKRSELGVHGDLPTSSPTLAWWLAYWLENVAAKRVRPNTLAGYRTVINAYIVPKIGHVRLDKLTTSHIRSTEDAMIAAGKSSTYALLAHRTIAKALEDAKREGRVTRNVAELMDAPRKARVDVPALDVAEAVTVIAEAVPELDGTGEYDHEPVLWATYLLTAARRGEILGLERDRITDVLDLSWQLQRIVWEHGCGGSCGRKRGTDCPKRRVQVPADYEYRPLAGGLYLTRPKSSAGWRIIPLVEPLRTLLARHLARASENPYGLVFATTEGMPLDPDRTSSDWTDWRRAHAITDRDVTLHGLRHTTVDLLLEAGVPEDVIVEIVGHSMRATTRGYKSRTKIARRTAAMEQLSQMLAITAA